MKGYELGHRQPGADALAAFAATGVNINWLLTGVGPMHAAQPVETCQIGQVAGSGAGAQPPAGGIPGPQRFGRRLDALAGMLGNMPDAEASALIDEFASRAQTQQQLSELKQAVQQLKQGQAKRG